jgi:glutathione S-transferase
MLIVHHLNNSRSQRVLWLLEELGVPYEIHKYERDPKTMLAPPELARIHPLGKSPVVVDDGAVVAESGAILEHILDKYGAGMLRPPAGTDDRRRFTYWLHFAEGSAMPPLLLKLVFDRVESGPMPFFVKPVARGISRKVKSMVIEPNLKRQLDFMEGELERSEWFAGPAFTAADIQMSFPLEAAAARAPMVRQMPRLAAFLDRIHARPAYKRALERGGPYELMK